MKTKLLFIGLMIFMGFQGLAQTDELIVEYDNPTHLNYGTEITLRFYYVNKKGKKKEMNKSSKDNFQVTKTNCDFEFYSLPRNNDLLGKLILAPRPSNPNDSIITIDFNYTDKKETGSKSLKFVLNYKGEIKLNFSGVDGKSAKTFDGLGQAIFSNKSHDGDNGGNGTNGKDLEITLAKKYFGTDSNYVMTIHDLNIDLYYQYNLKPSISQISISSNGGNGGEGSDGTRGSYNNRFRVDGGNAGNGGNGGNAGKILFYLDEKASELQFKIALSNLPGKGGLAGIPGEGVTHKEHTEYVGIRGKTGLNGTDGIPAEAAKIELRKFN